VVILKVSRGWVPVQLTRTSLMQGLFEVVMSKCLPESVSRTLRRLRQRPQMRPWQNQGIGTDQNVWQLLHAALPARVHHPCSVPVVFHSTVPGNQLRAAIQLNLVFVQDRVTACADRHIPLGHVQYVVIRLYNKGRD